LTSQSTNYIHFPIRKDTIEENLSTLTVREDEQKKYFFKKHIIVRSIHSSLRSESKMLYLIKK